MLAENQHRGADFEALTALANLILLGLSMVVDEDPPLIPPVNTSKRIDAFAFEPDCMASNLLRKALIRVSVNQGCLLTSDTTFDLRAVLEFIASAERKSISELHILHKATILTRSRETTISETESAIMTTNKTAQIINTCCRLAINIFWSILRSTVLDRRQKSPSPSTSAGSTTSYSALAPLLETLRTTLRALDLVTWKKHAPEAYLWICLTAAAACDAPASRVPFVAVVPPLLTASDTTELSLARECWRYYKWLAGLATSCNASDVGLETSSLGLEYTLDYDML
ncbi:hypothetical protein BJY04DRAFT_40622 [Aspergillus karnatakaensis]|uniref:uncharacterized protein n=1 Tax=Aspergillus karnatakaensis TaxID=1810916 RepID=UPI003CCD41A9